MFLRLFSCQALDY